MKHKKEDRILSRIELKLVIEKKYKSCSQEEWEYNNILFLAILEAYTKVQEMYIGPQKMRVNVPKYRKGVVVKKNQRTNHQIVNRGSNNYGEGRMSKRVANGPKCTQSRMGGYSKSGGVNSKPSNISCEPGIENASCALVLNEVEFVSTINPIQTKHAELVAMGTIENEKSIPLTIETCTLNIEDVIDHYTDAVSNFLYFSKVLCCLIPQLICLSLKWEHYRL
ncbi:hypothetical protein VNO78_28700 [Psophocarpus tetragonolobus]|uniref:Uncharacterized protein n=1 Tax=Psophocarpus tetragonolobus TaxID=3891 RepID=A0AAN9RTM5_PSOTE